MFQANPSKININGISIEFFLFLFNFIFYYITFFKVFKKYIFIINE